MAKTVRVDHEGRLGPDADQVIHGVPSKTSIGHYTEYEVPDDDPKTVRAPAKTKE